MRKKLLLILSLIFVSLIAGNSIGSEYPTREIEVIAGFGPGSAMDLIARLAAKYAEKPIGKSVIVVNRPGGGGSRGSIVLAAAKPDGYTLGLIAPSGLLQPYLMKGVTFHYKKSYRIICQLANSEIGIYVKKGGPFDLPLKDFIAKAKEKPGTIKAGIGATWSGDDFARAILEEETGVKFIRVPFPGGGTESVPALLGGHSDVNFGSGPHWAPLYKAGKLNVLAIGGEKRDPRFPEIPTFKEYGYEMGIAASYWMAAPAGTPDAIIQFLAEAFKKGCAEKGYKEGMDNLGLLGTWENPADSLKSMERMESLFLKIIRKYDLKPQ